MILMHLTLRAWWRLVSPRAVRLVNRAWAMVGTAATIAAT